MIKRITAFVTHIPKQELEIDRDDVLNVSVTTLLLPTLCSQQQNQHIRHARSKLSAQGN